MTNMKFTFYNNKNLQIFEDKIKQLALDKDHKFSKREEILKEEDILDKSNKVSRELLKTFKDNAKITNYSFYGKRSNYEIVIGETRFDSIISVYILFNSRPYK
ncbi:MULTISPECIES: hypothetical protein [Staphylococcus]|uniref:hypothetical protein n=1 Tax=Staphylococcus TaxID=1279 RepID=UPI0002D70DF7|nr:MULTISPECIES: hypothetical protein [Staphylococcus]KDP68816.1 hypothetical protein SEVCU013_1005 [Staphylococcus epidermidis VCU013]UTF65581.1 hypothetical protein MNU53_00160 [Staphylococcus epidermidis]